MSFQLLKFTSNNRSSSKDNSPIHSKTPHVRLKEEEYPKPTSFAKDTIKYGENASTETMQFFKSMASPQSLTLVKTPKSPSDLKSMLPPLIIKNSKRSSLQVEPEFKKLPNSVGKSFEEVEDRAVSKVLQDFSPLHNEHKPHSENRVIKDKSAPVSGRSNTELKPERKLNEEVHNEPIKDELSKSGMSFIDSRRMFIIDERSSRKQDALRSSALNNEEDAISEEDNNASLCSGRSPTAAQRIDIFSKYSQPVNEQNTGAFSNLRNLYQDLEPLGSQTHRGTRRGSLVGRTHSNNEEEEDRTVNEQSQSQQEQVIQIRSTETQNDRGNVDILKIADIDASLALRKICALCIAIGLSTFFLLPMISNYEGYRKLFLVIYGFLAYNILENGRRLQSPESHDWKRKDRIFDFLDAIAMIVFLGCVDLRLMHIIPRITVTCIPLLLLTITYYFVSSSPRSTKDVKTLIRFLYTCQALLIALKLSGYIDWEWKAVVLVLWAYFSFTGLYSIIIAILLIAVIFVAIFRLQSYTASNLIIRAIGLLWYSAYQSLSIIALVTLFGMGRAYDSNEDTTLLEQALISARYAVYGILAYTLVFFFQLKKFIKTFNQNQTMVEDNDTLVGNIQPTHVLDFQVEKAPSYFVMLSSTYFLPLHEGFLTKSKARFQRLKSGASLLKLSTSKSRVLLQPDSTTVPNKTLIIEELKKDKEALDQKLEGPPETLKSSLAKTLGFLKLKKLDSTAINLTQQPYKGETHTVHLEEGYGSMAVDNKFFASVDDMYDVSPICKNRIPAREEENTCYICFERAADAVLMDCGHAGICCECAINMIKDKNECMECRKAVKAVYKVEKNLKLAGIVKGSKLTKVIEIGAI